MRRALFTGVALAAALALGTAGTAQAAPQHRFPHRTAEVSILHAVPNTPVDVYLNHKRILNDFEPGTLVGPLNLKAGTYTVSITAATAKNDRHPVIGPVKLQFHAARSYTVVAHLTASGKPTATKYLNTIKKTPKGDGRLIVRHVAAAPAVDVYANGKLSMRHLRNPHQSKANVPAGTYRIAVTLAGKKAPVIGPAPVKVKRYTDTIVYAWGSAAQGNLTVAVQTVRTNR
ncbi:DUF4397 domain-containing protein [Amnibacterium kyonggiense]|uniref:Uncharacterized protein DUF4397 n=1 Tax=Amnibacterium kyonggiense TaxID=595671 RepID=A0A4R7FLF3_9MICO|nr:DUF4397 domain-containing protein [Amnibacterium kyonggiense]TDS77198.1 uncharacterized protein DUF4397 [Amnibacterium kyonggiense]